MHKADWEREIRLALERQETSPSGPAGETPVGQAAASISRVDPSSPEMLAIVAALTGIISESREVSPQWWKNVANLIRFSGIPLDSVKRTLVDLLATRVLNDAETRAVVMLVLADIGYRFNRRELDSETGVKSRCGMQWIEVTLASGHVEHALDQVASMLDKEAISFQEIALRLPLWYRNLGERLVQAASQWYPKLRSDQERRSLQTFFTQVGVESNPKAPGLKFQQPVTSPRVNQEIGSDSGFLRSATKREHRRLNGSRPISPQLD